MQSTMVAVGLLLGVTAISPAQADSIVSTSYTKTTESATLPTNGCKAVSHTAAPIERDGLFGGVSFGRGSIEVSCQSCDNGGGTLTEGLSLEGHLGFMLTPQIAVVGEHWNVRYNQRGGALFDDNAKHLVAQHISTLGAQLFLGNFWFRTGLGVGWHISDGDYTKQKNPQGHVFASVTSGTSSPARSDRSSESNETDSSPLSAAYYAAVGWEFAHNQDFAAEVQLRVAGTKRPSDEYQVRNVGINVGLSWY